MPLPRLRQGWDTYAVSYSGLQYQADGEITMGKAGRLLSCITGSRLNGEEGVHNGQDHPEKRGNYDLKK